MQPYQERVLAEKAELDERAVKLCAFIGSPAYKSLPIEEQSRMDRQLDAMQLYSNILQERITAFTS